jgi:hypothetical protein
MVLVTTHWELGNKVTYRRHESHHQQLEKDEWKDWIEKGRPLHRLEDETPAAAEEIVRTLFQNEIRLRRIQKELAAQMKREPDQQRAAWNLRKGLESQLASSEGGQGLEVEAEIRLLRSYGTPSHLLVNFTGRFQALRRAQLVNDKNKVAETRAGNAIAEGMGGRLSEIETQKERPKATSSEAAKEDLSGSIYSAKADISVNLGGDDIHTPRVV